MSFSDFLKDHLAMADFGDWLLDLYLLDSAGVAATKQFSRHGTATGMSAVTVDGETIAAHTPYRKRLLRVPTWQQSLWAQGAILSRSFPNYGSLLLNNQDGGLEVLHPDNGYQWANKRARCCFGRGRSQAHQHLASTIGKTIDAVMDRPRFTLATVEVPLLGYESRFQQSSSKKVYRGTSYMLEMKADAANESFIAHGVANNGPNLTGDLTLESWLWIDAVQSSSVCYYGWISITGFFPFSLQLDTNRKLIIAGYSGGTLYAQSSTAALPLQGVAHFAVTITGRDVRFVIWDDDSQTETVETYTNVFPAGARNAATNSLYRTLRVGNGATLWGDDWRVWNTARTLAEIRAYRHRPLIAGAIPASCVHYERYDDGTGTSVTDSSASGFTGTITHGGTGTSAWYWAQEGTADLAGTPKPDIWGQNFAVPDTLVDHLNNGNQIAGGGRIQAINAIRAGGYDNYIYDGNAASYRAYLTTTPAAGHVLTYLMRGLFKLGSTPTLPLSVKAQGYRNGNYAYVEKLGGMMWDFCQQRGPKLTLVTDFDDTSREDFDTATSNAIGGFYLSQPVLMADVNDLLARSGAGWWGYVRGSRKLEVNRYVGAAATADHSFDTRHIVEEPKEIVWLPVGELVVKYQRNHVVLSEEQISAAIRNTSDWQRFTQEWLEEKRSEPGVDLAATRSLVIETALYNQSDAATLADYLWSTLKGEKKAWAVSVKVVGLEVQMGQTVALTWQDTSGNTRIRLDGDKYVVLTVSDRRQEGRVDLEVLSA